MHKYFNSLYDFFVKNKLVAAIIAIAIVAICLFFISKINFEEDINQVIPKNEKSQVTAKVLQQLNFSDKLVVIIENHDSQNAYLLTEIADTFLERIQPLHSYIRSIQGKVGEDEISNTFDFVQQHLPILLDSQDYLSISQLLHKDSIVAKLQANYNQLISPAGLVTKEFIKKDPLGIVLLGLKKLNELNVGNGFKMENNYIVSGDGQSLLLFIDPIHKSGDTKKNEPFIDSLHLIKDLMNANYAGQTTISYYGSPVIAVSNAQQIKKDIQNTVIISMSLLFLVLVFYFRNWLIPVIVFIPTALAVLIALTIMYFLKDQISAISLSIGAILIGITIDYALHILTHYKYYGSIQELYKEICRPLILSSATTAVSFLCLLFVKSEALKDLGIFAAISVMLSALIALIVIPLLYKQGKKVREFQSNFIDRIAAYPFEKNKWLIGICSVLVVLGLAFFNKVKFNNNIADLNYVSDELKESETKFEKLSDLHSKSVYTIAYADHEEEALNNNANLYQFLQAQQAAGNIRSFSSIGNIVLSQQSQQTKINQWNTFWTSERKNTTLEDLAAEGSRLGFNSTAFKDFGQSLAQVYTPIPLSAFQTINALQVSGFIKVADSFVTISNIVKVSADKRDAFIAAASTQQHVLAIDRQQMNENFLGLLKDDFSTLLNYSLLAIFLIILGFLRNLELSLLTMMPIVLTGIVTAGILYLSGIELNIFSTVVCTLVFGVGDDFSIFLTQAMQKEHTSGKNELPTYRTSIMLAVLTTILSIGSLIFAKHPALHSLALTALIGMFTVIIITAALYPFWYRILITNRQKKGFSPINLRLFLTALFSFLYYGIVGFIFSFLGAGIIKMAKRRKRDRYEKWIARALKSVLHTSKHVSKKVINNPNENFGHPAVIIANHTSFLDTLTIAMVTHKTVYVVNDWVYKSPVFGKLVKALGFFPVSEGIENGMELLKTKVAEGYNIVIFPEGHRAYDNNVKRFHKGAFHIADTLGIDILPFYIHGNADVLPKDDFIIYDGSITIKTGDRIAHDDPTWGLNVKDRTKNINAFFRQEFAKIRAEIEDKNYFKKKLFWSFLYKDNTIVKAVKEDFNKHSALYFELNKHLPTSGPILHIADDYGQLDFLLTMYQAGRSMHTFISDDEKRAIATQNYIVRRRKIHYLAQLPPEEKRFETTLVADAHFDWRNCMVQSSKIIILHSTFFQKAPEGYKITYQSTNMIVLTAT